MELQKWDISIFITKFIYFFVYFRKTEFYESLSLGLYSSGIYLEKSLSLLRADRLVRSLIEFSAFYKSEM